MSCVRFTSVSHLPFAFPIAFPLLAIMAGACGPVPEALAHETSVAEASGAELQVERAPAYLDVEETFTSDDDLNRWFDLKHGLAQDFDDICGDTFCEGEFTNLQPMGFRCSVSVRTGQMKTCLWLFAGSTESVTPSTGNVRPTARFFSCTFPVIGTPRQMLDALLTPGDGGPLERPLPGTATSIYERLGDCL